MQESSWEERLKVVLNEFYEGNMLYYRQHSNTYNKNEEALRLAFAEIEKLELGEEAMNAISHLEEVENEASADYAAQSYLQGIADCMKFIGFIYRQ